MKNLIYHSVIPSQIPAVYVREQLKIQLHSESPEESSVCKRHEEHLRSAKKFYSEFRLDTEMAKTYIQFSAESAPSPSPCG